MLHYIATSVVCSEADGFKWVSLMVSMAMSVRRKSLDFSGFVITSQQFLIISCLMVSVAVAQELAITPPRGWNSYDSFSWTITEDQFLANAQIVASTLKSSGYQYVVIDFLWFRMRLPGASVTSPGFDIIDEWGRPVPDPVRWPSTAGGKGFAPIADKVHAMGLKFGIHVMRGISTAAVANNTPILGAQGSPEGAGGRPWSAQDIALTSQPCSWMPGCFVSVNTSSEGGTAFINSLYQQYASWGVDFVKHDCVFGADDLSLDEITAVSQAIANTSRPIVYSLSPGVCATPSMGSAVNELVHMYRVTSDDWDTWGDVALHFDVARDFAAAGLIGAQGLQDGYSWPDLDMLPLGWLTDPGANKGPHRPTNLSPDEQKSQITLWAMAKSPLMYGGDLRQIDQDTLDLITNPVMLNINAYSFGNAEIAAGPLLGSQALPVLSLAACSETKGASWAVKKSSIPGAYDQLCWTIPTASIAQTNSEGCLNWTMSSLSSISGTWQQAMDSKNNIGHLGNAHVWSYDAGNMCLDSLDYRSNLGILHLSNLEAHAGIMTSGQFLPCSKQKSQTWQLTSEGKLTSPSTGLCATVDAQVNVKRVWAARGSDGEFYVAFFNLGMNSSSITLSVDELTRSQNVNVTSGSGQPSASTAAPSSESSWQCTGTDVWNNQIVNVFAQSLSAIVPSHGCVLYSLTCTISN